MGATADQAAVDSGVLTLVGVDQAILEAALPGLDTLGALREMKSAEVRAACKTRIERGVEYKGRVIPTTEVDQLNLTGVCLAAVFFRGDYSTQLWAKGDDWERVTYTWQELVEIGQATVDYIQAQQARHEQLLAQIKQAATVEELQAITWDPADG